MTSAAKRFGTGLVVVALGQVQTSAVAQPDSPTFRPNSPGIPIRAPAELRERITELGRGFNGRVGIAVHSIDQGWTVGWKADEC